MVISVIHVDNVHHSEKIGFKFHLDVKLKTYLLHFPLLLCEGLPQLGRELPLPARLERQLDHLATVTRGGWAASYKGIIVSEMQNLIDNNSNFIFILQIHSLSFISDIGF